MQLLDYNTQLLGNMEKDYRIHCIVLITCILNGKGGVSYRSLNDNVETISTSTDW